MLRKDFEFTHLATALPGAFVECLTVRTLNAGVVSSIPLCLTIKTPLVRKETGNPLIQSISLEKAHGPVFCFFSNTSMQRSFKQPLWHNNIRLKLRKPFLEKGLEDAIDREVESLHESMNFIIGKNIFRDQFFEAFFISSFHHFLIFRAMSSLDKC